MKKLLYVLLLSLSIGNSAVASVEKFADKTEKGRLIEDLASELRNAYEDENSVIEEKSTLEKVASLPGAFVEIVKAHPRFALGALSFIAAGFAVDFVLNKDSLSKWKDYKTEKTNVELVDYEDGMDSKKALEKADRKGAKCEVVREENSGEIKAFRIFDIKPVASKEKFSETIAWKDEFEKDAKLEDLKKSLIEKHKLAGDVNYEIEKDDDGNAKNIKISGYKQDFELKDRFFSKEWIRDFLPSAFYKKAPEHYFDTYLKPVPVKAWKFAYTDRGTKGRILSGLSLVVVAGAVVYLYNYAKQHNPQLIEDISNLVGDSSGEDSSSDEVVPEPAA